MLFGRHCVAPILLELARAHPALDVEVSFTDHLVDLVAEGFDLAVRVGPLADSASLAARRLMTQHMGICAAPSYLARHGTPENAEDLMSAHTGIVYGRGSHERPWHVRDGDGRVRELRIRSRLRLDDLQSIVDAAVAGAGLAWLPCWLIAPHVREGSLELITACELVLPTEIYAVWPQSRYLPSKTRMAIDALVTRIPALIG